MALRKNTQIKAPAFMPVTRIHTWIDDTSDFKAEAYKDVNGWWHVTVPDETAPLFDRYSSVTDFVMDKWRLAKSGYDSWEDAGRDMAEDDWDSLSDFEKQDLIDAAQQMAKDEWSR